MNGPVENKASRQTRLVEGVKFQHGLTVKTRLTFTGFWRGNAEKNVSVIDCFFFGTGTERTLNGSKVNDTCTQVKTGECSLEFTYRSLMGDFTLSFAKSIPKS